MHREKGARFQESLDVASAHHPLSAFAFTDTSRLATSIQAQELAHTPVCIIIMIQFDSINARMPLPTEMKPLLQPPAQFPNQPISRRMKLS